MAGLRSTVELVTTVLGAEGALLLGLDLIGFIGDDVSSDGIGVGRR